MLDAQATRRATKKLEEDCLPRFQKYEAQAHILAGRSYYQAKDNRQILISFRLLIFRRKASVNLTSPNGQRLRAYRSIEVGMVFSYTNHNMDFHRFQVRGLEKVKTRWILGGIPYNHKKMPCKGELFCFF